MNKTININLGGIFFHIDEQAYTALRTYLDRISRSLSEDSQGKEEIINDIEMRISEILSERIKDSRQVVSLNDIEDIIQIMGKPEDYEIESDYTAETPPYSGRRTSHRKLYRDADDSFYGWGLFWFRTLFWNRSHMAKTSFSSPIFRIRNWACLILYTLDSVTPSQYNCRKTGNGR